MTCRFTRVRPRRLLGCEKGAATAEFVIVVPAFLVLVFAIIEFALVWWNVNTLRFAVDDAARYAILVVEAGSDCAGSYQSAVQQHLQNELTIFLPAASSPTPSVTVSCPASGATMPTATFTIAASSTFSFFLSTLVPFGPITLQQQTEVQLPLG
jgi:Flp pilus assembly protein TadG